MSTLTREDVTSFISLRTVRNGVMGVRSTDGSVSEIVTNIVGINIAKFVEGKDCKSSTLELFMFLLGVKFDLSKTKYSAFSDIDESANKVFEIIQNENLDVIIKQISSCDCRPGIEESYTPEEVALAEKLNGLSSIK